MTWKLGRVGYDVTLPDPSEWNSNGDRVSISGWLNAATQTDVNVLREQMLGYADNPDEEVVPVTWSIDSRVDGFYRVLGVQVSENPNHRKSRHVPYQVELERVPGFASPLFESVLVGALRTNAHSITTTNSQPWHAYPTAVAGYDAGLGGTRTYQTLNRDSADGDIRWLYENQVTSAPGFYDATPIWYLAPANWYVGAATIEVGATLRKVVGRQITNLPTDWRLSNGFVRVTPVAGSQNFDVSHFDGATWETAKRFEFRPLSLTDPPHAVTVLRNSAVESVVRCSYVLEVVNDRLEAVNVDFGLRRGSRTVTVVISASATAAAQYGIGRTVSEASTALTGGIRATADDVGGNRFFLTSSKAFTSDLTVGRITATASVTLMDVGIGMAIGGSTAVAFEREQDQIYQYMAAQSESVSVVGR